MKVFVGTAVSCVSLVLDRLCTLAPKIKGRDVAPLNNSLAVPTVDNLLDLRVNAIPMLQALGPSLHMDPVLMYKILRICKVALADVSLVFCCNLIVIYGRPT